MLYNKKRHVMGLNAEPTYSAARMNTVPRHIKVDEQNLQSTYRALHYHRTWWLESKPRSNLRQLHQQNSYFFQCGHVISSMSEILPIYGSCDHPAVSMDHDIYQCLLLVHTMKQIFYQPVCVFVCAHSQCSYSLV